MTPLNGNVLVIVLRNQTEEVFSEADSKKDLQYAKVEKVAEGSKLEIGSKIVYNPRNLNNIVADGELKGFVHETQIIAIV